MHPKPGVRRGGVQPQGNVESAAGAIPLAELQQSNTSKPCTFRGLNRSPLVWTDTQSCYPLSSLVNDSRGHAAATAFAGRRDVPNGVRDAYESGCLSVRFGHCGRTDKGERVRSCRERRIWSRVGALSRRSYIGCDPNCGVATRRVQVSVGYRWTESSRLISVKTVQFASHVHRFDSAIRSTPIHAESSSSPAPKKYVVCWQRRSETCSTTTTPPEATQYFQSKRHWRGHTAIR